MTIKKYLGLITLGTLACWTAFVLVIMNLDPNTGSWIIFMSFYTTLFLALLGTFAVLGMGIRLVLLRQEEPLEQVLIAFRQSFSFAFLVVASLFLQSQDLLQWWNILMLIAALTLVEWAVLLRQRRVPLV
jgi:hypothetical protein